MAILIMSNIWIIPDLISKNIPQFLSIIITNKIIMYTISCIIFLISSFLLKAKQAGYHLARECLLVSFFFEIILIFKYGFVIGNFLVALFY